MSVYTLDRLTQIQNSIKSLPQKDREGFDGALLVELSTLIQQQSTLTESSESSPFQPDISQTIQKLEKRIDETIAVPLYEKLAPKPKSQQMVAKPSESTMARLYLFNLLGAIPFFGNFFRALIESQEKKILPQQIRGRSKIPQPADAPRVDEELQQFLSSRCDFVSHSHLKNSIITKLKSSVTPLPQDLIKRIQALKHPRALGFLGHMYRVERGELKMVDRAAEEGNVHTAKWKNVDFNHEEIVKELESYVKNAEKKQREYIVDEVLEHHRSPDIQERLSDIRYYEETLKYLVSGFDINDSNDVYFIGPEQDSFLQSVLKQHTERQKQLASDVNKYLEDCKEFDLEDCKEFDLEECKEFDPPIEYLDTALAFADPSQQMNFVDIMKNTENISREELRKQLSGYFESFDLDFLEKAKQALDELNKTTDFPAAFAQASHTDRRQLILDYQLPDSIHQSCLDFLDNKKYAEYIEKVPELYGDKVDDCLSVYLKSTKQPTEEEISEKFKKGLQSLSLQELKGVESYILSVEVKYGSNDVYKELISDELEARYFPSLHPSNVFDRFKEGIFPIGSNEEKDLERVVRINDKIRFLGEQQHLITEWSQKTGATIPLSQELAEKFIKDQSKPIDQMDLAMPSSHTKTHEKLQQLQQLQQPQQSAKQSTQRSHNLSELDRKRESPHSKSGSSPQL